MTKLPKLSDRLMTAVPYICDGDVVADIGTDHAYLPIYLILTGRASFTYACDINDGPCQKAIENARSYGVSDKVSVSRRDGITGLCDKDIDKFIIFGMGGELISQILSGEEIANGVRFILNPMTKQEKLRSYLVSNGFEILDENVVYSDSKYYQIIYAEKNGKCEELSPAEQKFGKINIKKKSPIFLEYAEKTRGEMLTAKRMRDAAGAEKPYDDRLLTELEEILKDQPKTEV